MSKAAGKEWTADQAEAIRARGCNLLVSAAAGAGKTSVLVERIMSRITDEKKPVDIDRLLVVTYTNAAAAEMRERIASAISSQTSGAAGGSGIGRQLALLNRAKITTLHSFCMDILRKFFYRLGLDPGFRIADEAEALMLKSDIIEELFENNYADSDKMSGFTQLVECYGGQRDDWGLQDLVTRFYDFSRSSPNPDLWLENMAAKYDSPLSSINLDLLSGEVLSEVCRILEGAVSGMEEALSLCLRPGGPQGYAYGIKEEIGMLQGLLDSSRGGWDDAHQSFREFQFTTLKKAGPKVDEQLKDQVTDIRNSVKKKLKSLMEVLSRTLEEHAGDMKKLAPQVRCLVDLVSRFAENYRSAKVSRGLVDFSDLEHYCLQILAQNDPRGGLAPSSLALEIREQFEEVLVDEYQDINPVQEAIISMVAKTGGPVPNLFMVGDVKQSIYRFRLADPGLFLEKYLRFPVAAGGDNRRINLSRNFRSRPEVIDSVNYIFGQIMSMEAGELEYDSDARLVYGSRVYRDEGTACGQDYRVELYLMDRSRSVEEDAPEGEDAAPEYAEANNIGGPQGYFQDNEDLAPAQAEARIIAQRINSLIDQGFSVYDSETKAFRPVTYRDVVILMRATSRVSGIFTDELNNNGVPACADTGTGFYQSTEVEIIISLLRIIDNPRQDIPLAAVLRSPVCGLGAEDLAMVRVNGNNGELWDSVMAARNSEGDLAPRLSVFLESLDGWRRLARTATMTDLIWTVYRETGYYNYVGAMPGGAQRQANLRALHDRAGRYESTTFRGLFSFLRFIDRLREKGEDQGRARTLGENENVVRIMSIHKSKGLEFPVVVMAGAGKKFNMQDLNRDVLLHRDLGFGPTLVDTAARIAYPTLPKMAVREKLRRETLAEEMRILYVAMTRAREKLIITGTVANLKKAARSWCSGAGRVVSPADVLGAGSQLDWICIALARHTDGERLREMAAVTLDAPGPGLGSESRWAIHTGDIPDAAGAGKSQSDKPSDNLMEMVRRGKRVETPGIFSQSVKKRLSWEYPYREITGKAVKISVTGLGEKWGQSLAPHEVEEGLPGQNAPGDQQAISFLKPTFARPLFMSVKKDLTAAERGTAMHMIMRHLDPAGKLDAQGVAEQVASMQERDLLTGEQAAVADCQGIAGFFLSEPGQRFLKALSLKREVPFSLTLAASEIYPEIQGLFTGERVIIQGVIDCLADEGDGYIIIDYKTDKSPEAHGRLPEKYQNQMKWYERAVESLTGRPVKDKYIYLFETGFFHRL